MNRTVFSLIFILMCFKKFRVYYMHIRNILDTQSVFEIFILEFPSKFVAVFFFFFFSFFKTSWTISYVHKSVETSFPFLSQVPRIDLHSFGTIWSHHSDSARSLRSSMAPQWCFTSNYFPMF